jgi:acyl-CoA synthetase (AMP-forming)/AMP-acid ligase II
VIADILLAAATREPDSVAFVDGDRRLTYAEWEWLSDRAAYTLAAEGLQPGDVVALLLQPSIHYPIAYLGASKVGCVTVGINPRLAEPEIDRIVDHSGARALVTDRPMPREPMLFSPADLNRPGAAPPRAQPDPDDTACIVYTSGTTGEPKGARYTYGALDAVRRIEASFDRAPHPRTLQAIPLPHMQFMTKIGAFIERLTTAVLVERWSARNALETIQREAITSFGGVPAQLALMLRDPDFDRFDLSSLRSVTLGGAPAAPELVAEIRERFRAPVFVRYSTTELAVCCGTRAGDPDDVVARTVGRPLPEVDVTIDGAGPDGVGEVCARSPAMMAGYWRRDDNGIDEHGYFRTGDLGFIRPDGNLVLVGRSKEMYIRGGYNVYPVEVENALREHARVAHCAVVGYPDEVLGERGAAFIVPADAADPPSVEELREHLARRIADYKLPDIIEIRAELPLNQMFKVDKRALAHELQERVTRAANP